MKLYHRTNYWGKTIYPSDRDSEISFSVIWLQAIRDEDDGHGCCYGHGRRVIPVRTDHLAVSDEWSLFLINGTQGQRNDSHYFFKFLLVPKDDPEFEKNSSAIREWGWTYVGHVLSANAMEDLDCLIKSYYDGKHGIAGCDRYHIHIALKIDRLVP